MIKATAIRNRSARHLDHAREPPRRERHEEALDAGAAPQRCALLARPPGAAFTYRDVPQRAGATPSCWLQGVVITDSLLQLFVRTLGSHKHVKRGAITRHDGESGALPPDVGRVLGHVGAWRYGDLRFMQPSQLDSERARLTNLATEFEAGRSSTWSHALWN